MHILLFGGSFDPPHLGHAFVAREVVKRGIADEVWFMPCGDHPFNRRLSDATHRLTMLHFLESDKIKVSTHELEREGKSYSLQTLQELSTSHPDDHFSWLMGSDQLPAFAKWNGYEELLRDFGAYVYPRRGSPLSNLLEGMTGLTDFPEIDITATDVRARAGRGEPIDSFVDPQVASYIREHHLYTAAHAAKS